MNSTSERLFLERSKPLETVISSLLRLWIPLNNGTLILIVILDIIFKIKKKMVHFIYFIFEGGIKSLHRCNLLFPVLLKPYLLDVDFYIVIFFHYIWRFFFLSLWNQFAVTFQANSFIFWEFKEQMNVQKWRAGVDGEMTVSCGLAFKVGIKDCWASK